MYILNVSVLIRKGLGPDMVERVFTQGYDDIDDEVTEEELKKWAVSDTEQELYSNEDYLLYGKNWIIGEVLFG